MMACKPISPWGHVIKPLSAPRLKEITNLLKQETARAISGKTDIVVQVDKVLNLYLVPDDLPERVKNGHGMASQTRKGRHGAAWLPRAVRPVG